MRSQQVFDVTGREVLTPIRNARLGSGAHRVTVDLRRLPDGVYLYRLRAAGLEQTRRMVVTR
jgi:hypothetical protein